MNKENAEFFLMQADKLLCEIFEQFSKDFYLKIDFKNFEDMGFVEESDGEIKASAFYSIIAQEQILSELKQKNESAFISRPFVDGMSVNFFLIYYDSRKTKIAEKYETFFEYLCESVFDYLIDEWEKENFYFYNSSLRGILVHNAVENLVIKVSKKCGGYEEVALYENINLSLLNILSDLCYQTYEKSETKGLIYFTDNVYNVDFQFKFENKDDFGSFSMENKKLIRKLLELTDRQKGTGIISDTNRIYGIGKLKEDSLNYNVVFENNHIWTLSSGHTELISMKNGNLVFGAGQVSGDVFKDYVSKNLQGMQSGDIDNLYRIIKSLVDQQKGTILVVMKDAKKYIDRYKDLAILVEPVKLDERNVEKLSSIDGAIFVDEKCICYGFGVVLDGIDTGSGSRARGSRYNSSERFFNWCKNQQNAELIVFVFSDDGIFNFFPEM